MIFLFFLLVYFDEIYLIIYFCKSMFADLSKFPEISKRFLVALEL